MKRYKAFCFIVDKQHDIREEIGKSGRRGALCLTQKPLMFSLTAQSFWQLLASINDHGVNIISKETVTKTQIE